MKMQENSGKKHRCSTGQSCGEWQPLISVIIPIYNAGQYLQQCIESVVSQTYRNLEIILVDDGSTDESPALCDAYAKTDARIKVIHKKNEGLVRARKTGVLQAGGEYITYVDADDWIDLNAYETIVGKTAGRQADMILYGLVEEYEDSRVEKQNAFAEGHYGKKALKETICPQMLCNDVFFRFGILPNLVCKLVRRELLREVQPMVSDEIEMGEDADCTFQMLAQAGSAQIIRYAPYHYRKRQDSMVRRATDLSRVSRLYTDLRKSFENSEERDALMPQLYRYMLFILLLKATERFVEVEAFEKSFLNKRIVLYGAGGFGQEMYRVLAERRLGEIVLWADKRYPVYRKLGLPVAAPEEIAACAYDMVFIAVLDTQVCERIAESLAGQGISREKISYIEPTEPYLEMVKIILENRPQISIVMPVYNGERYLREAVESVIAQEFTDWELLLVNDCSTDRTPAIMEEYRAKDGRICVIHNETNQRLPRSLNIGFAQAKGNYFTWTSDDNRYKPQALGEMFRYMETHEDVGLVFADMDYIDENGEKTGSVSREAEEIWSSNCVGACFLYRRATAEIVGGYDADLFLVEDYDYWLRIAKQYPITHLPQCLYEYRNHGGSLTQTKAEKIERQLYRLRCRDLDVMLSRAGDREKEALFIGMWQQNGQSKEWLKKKFFGEKGLPKPLQWIERKNTMDETKKIILFGAGAFGKKALAYFGEDRVAYFADNNESLAGSFVNGKEVISFAQLKGKADGYQVVISVDARKIPVLAAQLEENGITGYVTYLEQVNHLKKPSEDAVSWLEACRKAAKWIDKNSVPGGGIINNSSLRESYPEVTGYYIPTLMKWGFSELAVNYAKWLCSIQHADGAWYDTEGKDPYVFDTAQILKGLLAVRDRVEGAEQAIRKGCDWLLSNVQENGRLTTPSQDEWGEEGVCSELIHLYCLSPLYEAAEAFGEPKYREAAEKVADHYIREHGDEISTFGFLSHFYAYVMEALCDIGREGLARGSMKQMEQLLEEKGYVPAYRDVDWVCSTGMFQLAIVWFKLGDLEHGNKALAYAAKLQNESGGWYGSYPTKDAPRATDRKEYPDYFADAEISWAVKYFLDAVYFKNKLEFEGQAHIFKDSIAEDDGRYRIVLKEIKDRRAERILDAGCGKGRYLKNLLKENPDAVYYAADISKNVMQEIKPPIEKREGTLTQLPYADGFFDLVYTVEALEHSIFPENALRELLRVTKKGGEVIVIDKDQAAMGLLEIDEWEQWFTDEMFEQVAEEEGCTLRVVENVSYEDGVADGLFNAWILKRR